MRSPNEWERRLIKHKTNQKPGKRSQARVTNTDQNLKTVFEDFWRISLGNVISVLVFIGGIVYAYAGIQYQIKHLTDHIQDAALHMPLERKYDLFVSRTEYAAKVVSRNVEINDIKLLLRDIKQSQDRLYDRLYRNSAVP